MHPLKQLIKDNKNKKKTGICSICSANSFVIEAAMKHAIENNLYVLIEATANQINQYGGYTGMKPDDFANYVRKIALKLGVDKDKLILGGDHLGPLTWKDEKEETAMKKAEVLINDFVLAGFTKIHIDTSMRLGDDDQNARLEDATIAQRAARLCTVAKSAYNKLLNISPDAIKPVYVVGSEVPIPGGAQEDEETVAVTTPEDFNTTVKVFQDEFNKLALEDEWNQVIAVVVQPGVEFGDSSVCEYDKSKAKALVEQIEKYPSLVFEGHSTDYQTKEKLREMVQDSISILKVGPALTFALREALYALESIEIELHASTGIHLSDFRNVLDNSMLNTPNNWEKHYHGTGDKMRLKRMFSFSDRCRYYLPMDSVNHSIKRLINNLNKVDMPLSLISQYMPIQYTKIREGKINKTPYDMIIDRIINCLDEYYFATK